MKYQILLLLIASTLVFSCAHPRDEDDFSVSKGRITVAVDESFKPIADAEIIAYKAHYPETEFDVIYTPEQKAINLMLKDSADLCVVSRELTADEQKYFIQRNLKYSPGNMALDAVTLIVNKNNGRSSISVDEIERILKGEPSDTKLVFDNSSSSNLNSMLNKFNITEVNKTNIFAAKGTLDVFDYVNDNSNSIGLIGLNWISDEDDKKAMELKNSIKVLGIESESGIVYPTMTTMKNQDYPFVKVIYLHTTQREWGVALGFVRFACTQIGQLVVEKMGLQPFHLIPKQYELNQVKPYNVIE
jgi:phosphate transport system substrate-binding protein